MNWITKWKNYKLLSESGLPRIINILRGGVPSVGSVAFVTAQNPHGNPLSDKENALLNRKLEKHLRELNFGFNRIKGKFGEFENSFMIPNISRQDAVRLGTTFEQQAIIWGEKNEDKMTFEYIEGDTTIQKRDVVLSSTAIQSREDFYSQERQSGKRKFLIPFFDEDYEIVGESHILRKDVPDKPEFKIVLENIESRLSLLDEKNKTGKYYWQNRGVLEAHVDELKKLMK